MVRMLVPPQGLQAAQGPGLALWCLQNKYIPGQLLEDLRCSTEAFELKKQVLGEGECIKLCL